MLRNSTTLRRLGAGAATITIAGLLPVFASSAALASSVTNQTLTLNPTTPGATATATVTFTATTALGSTSSTGTGNDSVTLVPNGGETLSTNPANYTINGTPVMGVATPGANGSETLTLANGQAITAGSQVTVVAGGATNPPTGGQVFFGVNTSKDLDSRNTNTVSVNNASGGATAATTVTQVSPVAVPSTTPTVFSITGTNFSTTAVTTAGGATTGGNTVRFTPAGGTSGTPIVVNNVPTSSSTTLAFTGPNTLVANTSYDVQVSPTGNDMAGTGTNYSAATPADVVRAKTGLTYIPLAPQRFLDTRTGFNGPKSQVAPGQTLTPNLGGGAGGAGIIPPGATAVAINLTTVSPTGPGYVTARATAATGTPNTSTVNFDQKTDATGNFSVVALSADNTTGATSGPYASTKTISLTTAPTGGSVDLIGDVVGYFSAAYAPVDDMPAARVVDSRPGSGNKGPSAGPLGARTNYAVVLAPPMGATAVMLNATAVNAPANGNLRIFPQSTTGNASTSTPPDTAALQYVPGSDTGAFVTVPLAGNNTVILYSDTSAPTNVVIDVKGYLTAANNEVNVGPARAFDSRPNAIAPGAPRTITVGGAFYNGTAVSSTDVVAALVTVTSIIPGGAGNLRSYPTGTPLPNAATLNYLPGQARANFAIIPVRNGQLDLAADGVPSNVTVDIVGYF